MAIKHFCDDCTKVINSYRMIQFWITASHPLERMTFCYECFARHWKPITKKFSLKNKGPI